MMIMIIYTLITIVLIIYKNNNDRSQTAVVPMESHALARTAHATRAAAKRDARNKVFSVKNTSRQGRWSEWWQNIQFIIKTVSLPQMRTRRRMPDHRQDLGRAQISFKDEQSARWRHLRRGPLQISKYHLSIFGNKLWHAFWRKESCVFFSVESWLILLFSH